MTASLLSAFCLYLVLPLEIRTNFLRRVKSRIQFWLFYCYTFTSSQEYLPASTKLVKLDVSALSALSVFAVHVYIFVDAREHMFGCTGVRK